MVAVFLSVAAGLIAPVATAILGLVVASASSAVIGGSLVFRPFLFGTLLFFGSSALTAPPSIRWFWTVFFLRAFTFGFGLCAGSDGLLVENGIHQFLLFELVSSGNIQLLGNVPELSNLAAVQINDIVHVGVPLAWATLRSNFPEGARRLCTVAVRYKFTTSFADDNTPSFLAQFHHFWGENLTVGEVEPEQGPLPMETLHSSGPGIEVDPAPRLDTLHHQNVRMTADKDVGSVSTETAANAFGITSGPASYVGHPDPTALAFYVLMFRKSSPHQLVIDVAVHGYQRSNRGKGIRHLKVTNVSCMPYFITRGKVMQDPVIHMTMGVADKSNSHSTNFAPVVRLAPSWRSANG